MFGIFPSFMVEISQKIKEHPEALILFFEIKSHFSCFRKIVVNVVVFVIVKLDSIP